MLQEDSNGESSFEIIDKKNKDLTSSSEKTDYLSTPSSISSPYSMPSPSPSLSAPGGNLLSNVGPPSSLPDFTIWPSPTAATAPPSAPLLAPQTVFTQPQPVVSTNTNPYEDQFPKPQFSAAIPPSKGIPVAPPHPIEEPENFSGGFMGLVKEAFSSGGVLSKMAEKAKHSVDSIITTLDPQMSEYIYSSGDTELTVTSENEDEVSAIRDAIHSVFGKAWVNGIKLGLAPNKSQAIGFEAGLKNAEERIEYSIKYRKTPTVAIENILLQENNNWYDLSLLILKDSEKQITVQTFSQATPVPLDQFLKRIENERPDYKALSTEEKLALYLKSKPDWQQDVSGLTRKEVLLLAGKTLIRLYKNELTKFK